MEQGPERGRRLAKRQQRIKALRQQLQEKDQEIADLQARLVEVAPGGRSAGSMSPGNIVWMFGTGRSGSTWLSSMMGDLRNHDVWREPLVGALFGNLYYVRAGHRRSDHNKHFILSGAYKETWMVPMREMVLDGAAARFPEIVKDGGYLVIKEPNGSTGAPLLAEALPESRLIFLIRDPRDVVASSLDARKEGSWLYQRREKEPRPDGQRRPRPLREGQGTELPARRRPLQGGLRGARGPKSLVRYEDLRADTLSAP